MVAEDSLSSLSLSEDEPDIDPVGSKEIQHKSRSVSASMESRHRQIAKDSYHLVGP